MDFYQNEIQFFTLENGLNIVFKPDAGPVTYCGMVVNTGSRDEYPEEYGMAHFVEHMLFKGTQKRKSMQIINQLEHVGGELNAYTSKEETVIYASVLNEFSEKAIELIADVTFHSIFPEDELNKERTIIFDEIQSYNDSPAELIYDDFEELLFDGHSLAHNILGTIPVLENISREDLKSFVARQYTPKEMVFFISGNIGIKKLTNWMSKYLSEQHVSQNVSPRIAPQNYNPNHRTEAKGTHQAHFILGNRAYNLYHPQRMGMYLLNNILGGPGLNSLLNISLREKNGLVYNVDSVYQPLTDTGMWTVNFGCDPENTDRCAQLVLKTLKKLREEKLSDITLKRSKMQLAGQMALASENKENMALSMGKSYLRYHQVDDITTIRKKIEEITSNQLREIAQEIFCETQFSRLIYT